MNSNPKIKAALLCAVLVFAAVLIWTISGRHTNQNTISYSQFVQRVRAGQVAKVEIAAGNLGASPATIHMKDGQTSRTILPLDYSAVLALLEQQLANVEIQDASANPVQLLLNATPFLVLLAIWVVLMLNRRRFLRWRD